MRVLLLYNPIAGTGAAADAAETLRGALAAAGHGPVVAPTQRDHAHHWLDPLLEGMDLLVVIGGDGAVRQSVGAASRTGVPMYQFPFGTENLFAREFGMDRQPQRLVEAIERGEVRRIDLGRANGRWFSLMASVGLDAEVVHHLSSIRSGAISHHSYLMPTFLQFTRWRPRALEVTVDGTRIDNDRSSFVVVGNSRQYGWRLNPAYLAEMSDGQLDVALFPTRSRYGLIGWAARSRLGRLGRSRSLVYQRGRSVEIRASQPFRYQLDGDPPGAPDGGGFEAIPGESVDGRCTQLRVEIVADAMSVLVPPVA